jgi:splicing factor U2AF subunit
MRKMFAIEVATATSCILRRLAGGFLSLIVYPEDIPITRGLGGLTNIFIVGFRELRRQLFGRNRRRRSRSRSHSPDRHRGHEERPHGGRGLNRREDDREHHNERGRRPRSRSPARRGGRSSPGGRRNRSPVRESSAERRAKIEKWNREKEQTDSGGRGDSRNPENDRDNSDFAENGGHYDDAQH